MMWIVSGNRQNIVTGFYIPFIEQRYISEMQNIGFTAISTEKGL